MSLLSNVINSFLSHPISGFFSLFDVCVNCPVMLYTCFVPCVLYTLIQFLIFFFVCTKCNCVNKETCEMTTIS